MYSLENQNPRWVYKLFINGEFLSIGWGGDFDDMGFHPIIGMTTEDLKKKFPINTTIKVTDDNLIYAFDIPPEYRHLVNVVAVKNP